MADAASNLHRLLFAGLLTLLASDSSAARQVERVSSDARVPCASCTLTFGPEVIIGGRDDNYLDMPPLGYAVDSRGHVILSTLSQVQQFDHAGNFVRRIGRDGDGPGEFRRAFGVLVAPDDSVFVYHGAGFSVFDRDGAFARQARAPRTLQRPFRLETGEVVNQQNLGGPVGSPSIHVYDADGERRSFGPGTIRTPSGNAGLDPRVLAPSSGSSFWVAPRAPYVLERWNAAGELEFVLERRAEHHPRREYRVTYEAGRLVSSFPILSAVGEDEEGRVWTAVAVELEGWDGVGPRSGRRFESVIEVLDPRTGDLLGSGRVRGIVTWIGGGHLIASWEGDHGEPMVIVRRAGLERGGAGGG